MTIIVITGFFLVLFNGIKNRQVDRNDFSKLINKKQILTEVVQQLKKENEILMTEIDRINNSSEYAKKVFKEKYHILNENEQMLFFD